MIVKVNFHHVLFTLLDLLMKLGPIGCPKILIGNYQSTLCNISEEHRYNMIIWRHRSWFCSSWSGSQGSSLEQSSLVLHTWIQDKTTHLNTKFRGKTSFCIWVNMVLSHPNEQDVPYLNHVLIAGKWSLHMQHLGFEHITKHFIHCIQKFRCC